MSVRIYAKKISSQKNFEPLCLNSKPIWWIDCNVKNSVNTLKQAQYDSCRMKQNKYCFADCKIVTIWQLFSHKFANQANNLQINLLSWPSKLVANNCYIVKSDQTRVFVTRDKSISRFFSMNNVVTCNCECDYVTGGWRCWDLTLVTAAISMGRRFDSGNKKYSIDFNLTKI